MGLSIDADRGYIMSVIEGIPQIKENATDTKFRVATRIIYS